jgi:hypothetical protein
MALLVPDVGEVELLSRMLNLNSPDDVVLHLYTNDKTPAEGDVLGDYTESTATGYAAETLTGSSWSVSTTGGTTTGEYPQVTFTYEAAEPDIYGYYVTNNAEDTLLWAERFSDGPYAIPSGGGSVKITPKIELE